MYVEHKIIFIFSSYTTYFKSKVNIFYKKS